MRDGEPDRPLPDQAEWTGLPVQANWASPAKAARPTRPRSLRAQQSVLTATRELLNEGGLCAATIDAISTRSGVSKATIYKHWPSRIAIAAEAFGVEMGDAVPLPDTGDALEDLSEQVRQVSDFYHSRAGTIFAQLLAACVTDPEGARYFRELFLAGRREAGARLWRRAVERGEVDAGVDVETAIDLLFGPLIFRLISGHAPLSVSEADALSAAALNGLRAKDRATGL
ncbi:TetR/AcrR family transcriptional regulator [Streptosporangium lutulentum]|uniref:AcrR family transcriptional regulator n=1 Tax=Streptosporangium lutulentum TaxID=1461250 RepID=A0ABT9QJY0_9ACTN|nr:TetR/AcrR family transcriptional regulator [Streptosporangium lutulentum]MDP9846588.1 AcrR family transcriptional regulator [Streptosporangium lutulentum]